MALQYHRDGIFEVLPDNSAIRVATLSDSFEPDVMKEYGRLFETAPELLEALKTPVYALQYAAFNISRMTLDELEDNVIERTCPAKTALIAAREAIAAIQKATKGNLVTP